MNPENTNKKSLVTNSAPALAIVKEWLSVSESQICSTEVLSEQLPKINTLLETSMNEISIHLGVIIANSRKIGEEITTIDNALDNVDIGNKTVTIPNHLESLAGATSDKETALALFELAKTIKEQEKTLHGELKQATDNIKANTSAISEIVVGMQFQDRVSQNIMITINIMKSIVEYLEKEINDSLPSITKDERRKLIDKEFAKQILTTFRLGELQLSFVKHLIDHGYIESAEELDFSLEGHEKKDESDNVDLF